MSKTQVRVRHQQRVEELCAAAIRALSGEAGLHFRARRLHRGRIALPLFAAHLHPSLDMDDFGSFRGAADGLALRVSRSDANLHQSFCPIDAVERLVFDMLEQFRVEALAPDDMPGVAHNLSHRFEAWSLAFYHSGLTDSARGILLYTVAQTCRARVTGQRVLEATEDLIEATRGALGPQLGRDLACLRRTRSAQAAYAAHALNIARTVASMLQSTNDEDAPPLGEDADDNVRAAFSLVIDTDRDPMEQAAIAVSGRSRVLEAIGDGYRIFTSAYDRECFAATLVRPELLRDLRARLDVRVAGQGVNVARLARELHVLLAVPTLDGWDGDQEDGYIDGRRLSQLIASPTERRLFRVERIAPATNCVLAFLIDCSGSMREHIESVAMLVDVFVRALEQAGVTTEILGFTTGAWNGGLAQRDWLRAGRPPHPGRLNEIRHMVFKDADVRWQHARPDIAALLKGDLFREGIDGEAVVWACRRLTARAEDRKLLLVISDGSPMDSATNLANDPHYLDQHLRDVVDGVENAGQVEIFGVGVGLDLSPYYSRSHVLDLAGSAGNQIFQELMELLAGRARR